MASSPSINAFMIVPVDYEINVDDLCDMIHDATLDEATVTVWDHTLNIYYQKGDFTYNLFVDEDNGQSQIIELMGYSDSEASEAIQDFARDPVKFISSLS